MLMPVVLPLRSSCQLKYGRPGGTRTPNLRFWRPLLYQLSHWPVITLIPGNTNTFSSMKHRFRRCTFPFLRNDERGGALRPPLSHQQVCIDYSIIFATTPAPTVRPPSRIAKRRPSSIAIGAISFTVILTLSPGITISTPSGRSHAPVTSVVRK